ncbi:hypothetical protein J759_2174 [Acinetobacter baumannii 24845_6]|nr:hypothetical protein J759_2174 [Acinetobacter baumannii 24845_6]
MAGGHKSPSPLKNTETPTGYPPASKIPFFTCSAIFRKCALHGVSSDHVLQIPMIGLP